MKKQRPTLTLGQVETLYRLASKLINKASSALTYTEDAGFRQARFFIDDIQAMWDASRSDANKARMERKKEKRATRKEARRA